MCLAQEPQRSDAGEATRPFCGTSVNSATPHQTPQKASDQVLHHLLTEVSVKNLNKNEKMPPNNPKIGNDRPIDKFGKIHSV